MDDIEKTLGIALNRELESVKLYAYLKNRNGLDDYQSVISKILVYENEHVRVIRNLMTTHNFDNFGKPERFVSHMHKIDVPARFESLVTEPRKLVAFAIKREETSYRFYGKMHDRCKNHIILADISRRLMNEEENHKLELESLYRRLM